MAPQPPTESQILHSYLLHPSPLPTILPYKTFLSLLPAKSSASQQYPTELKRLYRDLQFQRDVLVDDVRLRIEQECTRSIGLTARLGRKVRREENLRGKRKRAASDEDEMSEDELETEDKETAFDTAMHDGLALGNTLPIPSSKHNHNTASLLRAMETAAEDLRSEMADLEADIEKLGKQCEEKVGSLSDLRYGRFANARISGNTTGGSGSGVEDEVIAALAELKGRLEMIARENG